MKEMDSADETKESHNSNINLSHGTSSHHDKHDLQLEHSCKINKIDDACFKTPFIPNRKGKSPCKGRKNEVDLSLISGFAVLSTSTGSPSTSAEVGLDNATASMDSNDDNQISNSNKFERIGRHSYLCPRSSLYLEKKFYGTHSTNNLAHIEGLTSEIIVDEFSILLFNSLSDYKKLKSHQEKFKGSIIGTQFQKRLDTCDTLFKNKHKIKNKLKRVKVDSKRKLSELSEEEREKWRKIKERAKEEKRRDKDSNLLSKDSTHLNGPSTAHGDTKNICENLESLTPNHVNENNYDKDVKTVELLPNTLIDNIEQKQDSVTKRQLSGIGIAKNGLISNLTLQEAEDPPLSKIPKLELNEENRKMLIGIASTSSNATQLNTTTKDPLQDMTTTSLQSDYIKSEKHMSLSSYANDNVQHLSSIVSNSLNLIPSNSFLSVSMPSCGISSINRSQPEQNQRLNLQIPPLTNSDSAVLNQYLALKANSSLFNILSTGISPGLPYSASASHNDFLKSFSSFKQKTSNATSDTLSSVTKTSDTLSITEKLLACSNNISLPIHNSNIGTSLSAVAKTELSSTIPSKSCHWCKAHVSLAHQIYHHMDIIKKAPSLGIKQSPVLPTRSSYSRFNEPSQNIKKISHRPLSRESKLPAVYLPQHNLQSSSQTAGLALGHQQKTQPSMFSHTKKEYILQNTPISTATSANVSFLPSAAIDPNNTVDQQILSLLGSSQQPTLSHSNFTKLMSSGASDVFNNAAYQSKLFQTKSTGIQSLVDPFLQASTSAFPSSVLDSLSLQQQLDLITANASSTLQNSFLPVHSQIKSGGGGSLTSGTSDAAALRNMNNNLTSAQLATLLNRSGVHNQDPFIRQQEIALQQLLSQSMPTLIGSGSTSNIQQMQLLNSLVGSGNSLNQLFNSLAAVPTNSTRTSSHQRYQDDFKLQSSAANSSIPSQNESISRLSNGTIDPNGILAASVLQQQHLNTLSVADSFKSQIGSNCESSSSFLLNNTEAFRLLQQQQQLFNRNNSHLNSTATLPSALSPFVSTALGGVNQNLIRGNNIKPNMSQAFSESELLRQFQLAHQLSQFQQQQSAGLFNTGANSGFKQ